jgi:hypothetical protein
MRFAALLLAAVILASAPVSAAAQWIENGVRITTTAVGDNVPKTVSDGAGGAILAWYDDYHHIVVQRIDPYGRALWGPGGAVICSASNFRTEAQIASDGAGGAIVAWKDYRNGNYDIYAQRVNASGAPLWTANGVAVCTQSATQRFQKLASDGAGGAIIAWQDNRNGDYDIYAQRIGSAGTPQWTANGVPVCVYPWDQAEIQLIPRSAGGAFVVWADLRSGYADVYYDVLSASGTTSYPPSGNAMATTPSSEGYPRICEDGLGGAIVVWSDFAAGNSDIKAQRVRHDGSTLWTAGGVTVCADPGDQLGARVAPDGACGAIVVWNDQRRGYGFNDIYGQRLSSSGAPLWTADGAALVLRDTWSDTPEVVSDGRGGAILAWGDSRYGESDIFCQRVDPYGGASWTFGGAPVCVADNSQYFSGVACDGDAGAIFAWYDCRSGLYSDVYAQRIERNGYWGYPAPAIADIRDVPGDQGGSVDVAWDASRLDDWYSQLIAYYTLWRAIDHTGALALEADGASLVDSPSKIDPASKAPVIRVEQVGATTFYWKLISTVYAYYLDAYSETAATLFDSTAASSEYHYFQVIAHCTYQGQFWISPPDSGRSVDNLAPAPPAGLAGAQEYTPAGLSLAWSPNSEADLGGYAVYRGLSSDFVPSSSNLVASPPDTLWFDADWRWDGGYFYKVSALDVHGNESGFALLAPETITGTETPQPPPAAYLSQNFPNPFNPTTRIAFGLAAPANVSLRIYDAAGRLVRALVDGQRAAGHYTEIWDGRDSGGRAVSSGIYFYRLTAGSLTETRKMALLR